MILAGVNSLNKDMAILSNLLKKGIRLRDSLEQEYASPLDLQKEQLKKLLGTFGATCIEGAERESIARLWSRYGFEEKYRIVGVRI